MFVTYNYRFKNAEHYYQNMSARNSKLRNLQIPMLAIHSVDDPILHVDTYPTKIVEGICYKLLMIVCYFLITMLPLRRAA